MAFPCYTDRTYRVGLIGLGMMGRAMAARLIAAGHEVSGFDPGAEAQAALRQLGGRVVACAQEVAADVQVLVVMVRSADQAREVLLDKRSGVWRTASKNAVVWLASTVPPAQVCALADSLAMHGLAIIDGPVSGGAIGAREGTLTIMTGGDLEVINRARPVLEACATRIVHTGSVGSGSAMKLINQLLTASHITLAAEAVALSKKLGIDPNLMIDVIASSAGNSFQFQKRAPRMARGDHARQSTVNIFLKDLQIVLDTAHAAGACVPLAQAAYAVFSQAAAQGLGEDSDTRVLHVYERDGAREAEK